MRKGLLFGFIGIGSLLLVAAGSDRADAIPAFARKYKTACITCHATFPRLTALGEAIRLNGYKMPGGDELYVKDPPVSMGAEAYKQVFPNAVWPSDIPGLPPISLRLVTDYDFDVGGTKDSRTDFRIDEAALLAAGSFGENMSFFVEIGHEEPELELEVEKDPVTGFVTDVSVGEHESGTEFSAWLMWEDLFKTTVGENHLNLRFGTIGMQDRALPNTRGHNRITVEDYLYTTELMLHGHGNSSVGVEANGFGKHWRYNAGVQNGDGATSKKNYYAVASLKFGGLGYDGSGGTSVEGGLSTTPSGYWRDDAILIGGFYYKSYAGPTDLSFDRIGADARLNYKDLSLALGFVTGDNDATNEKKDIWFAEAEYFVLPWLQPYLRYENLSSDVADGDKGRLVVGAACLARANVKFNVEGRFYTKNDPIKAVTGDKNDEDRVVVRLDFAF
ncbi:MAG: hypothetical protein Kow00128_06850 [Deltaproteobacteria bacterium]